MFKNEYSNGLIDMKQTHKIIKNTIRNLFIINTIGKELPEEYSLYTETFNEHIQDIMRGLYDIDFALILENEKKVGNKWKK